ncbi:MAG TPA: protein translocase subunit SecF [Candidatus Pacearchaeota archaeon]|nr:protein translocase subunit SecF [Candidatus Pacearchaeota archaeon]HOK94182.1 protein translocase subunit SecF [Candidatus Pacearchaeota archaeon]HPO75178.1 protein translocase subunit SecF [Candidatus Pacearchaeota archaeon]
MVDFLKYSKLYFIFSGILILCSIIFLITWGLKAGIDFTGGSVIEVEFKNQRPSIEELEDALLKEIGNDFTLQEVGENGIILKSKEIPEETHQKIIEILGVKGELEEKRFETLGPAIGSELQKSTIIAIVLSSISIIIYIAFAFRRVSRPVSSWQYSIAAIIALLHDILITCGVFAFLGKFFNIEIDIPFVAALLTILGYSINDTIVVFDRCRENLFKTNGEFKEILNNSLNETLARSFFASFTTLFPLFAMLFFGGESLFSFVLALIIGISFGAYSSIFIATPLILKFAKQS